MRAILYILSTLFFMALIFAISGHLNGMMYVPDAVGSIFVFGSWFAIWYLHIHFYRKGRPPSD